MTSPRRLGSLIGAVFGLVYLLVNASPLPADAAVGLRVAAVIAFGAVVAGVARAGTDAQQPGASRGGFGPGYWPVVLGEVVALFVGLRLINGPLDASQAAVAWVSFVVGAHFVVLAAVFEERLYSRLGVALGACGVAGLVVAAMGADAEPIAVVSGVIPGAMLLAAGWWGTRTQAATC